MLLSHSCYPLSLGLLRSSAKVLKIPTESYYFSLVYINFSFLWLTLTISDRRPEDPSYHNWSLLHYFHSYQPTQFPTLLSYSPLSVLLVYWWSTRPWSRCGRCPCPRVGRTRCCWPRHGTLCWSACQLKTITFYLLFTAAIVKPIDCYVV